MAQYHYLFKFIIVGDGSVGKSCILLRYTEKQFRDEHDTTIGVEFGSQIFVKNEKTIKIQIWDTAGQDSFKSITRSYYKGSIGVFLVFDITSEESFHNVLKWYNEVNDQAAQNCQIVLVGNKVDLESHRKISTVQAKAFADQYKMQYIETSAKTNYNIDQLFENTAMDIVEKIEKKQIEFTNEDCGIKLGNYSQQQNKKKQDDDCKC
ncbi:unnamed protein product (macronuclear) [Paramecium tetraurelia]|uniref:Chromosome undetermined scaffold_5, whole genome shotgun sequence n=1 Tax=Paramecium tetraurelia TaxID=5888 RepID=Q3SD34_PARTE|nr:uncharacterized protein GSPATT00002354001 [Paramecium tetraurelia]CAI44531.1 rab_B35 [Paramecium tetraurelia]CAK82225.1 unnamed protein product [Paramecium tetraurelia]|eukprot:XP_001449622.1 hypothetical protein (macronuclear) [Paramecium tetraurelia strain d4-2]